MDKPFLSYSGSFPAILKQLKCTLVFSAYQAGKLLFASSVDGRNLDLFAKSFKRPMGLAVADQKLAVASKFEVDVFKNVPRLAETFPKKSKAYDALYIPQVTYYTGFSDIHEIAWGEEGLWAVNTSFSCLSLMDESYSFIPKWKPWFISELVPEDRCHMNGFALDGGSPAYVSMYDQTDQKEGWRASPYDSGLLVDVRNQKIVCDRLPMPHSPRVYGDKLYFLLSATGQVMEYHISRGSTREIASLPGFLRGLTKHENFLFVGRSAKRESSKTFKDLPIYKEPCKAGISVLDSETGEMLAELSFTDRVSEVFTVEIVQGYSSPCIIGTSDSQRNHLIHAAGDVNYWMKI